MKVGITGGIGSGKTYVCRLLQQRGYPVYLCDEHAKRLMQEDMGIRTQLKRLIGDGAYTSEGLNKPVIAQYLFQDKDNAQRINSIVHPVVMRDMNEWYGRQGSALCFIESAILFEAGLADKVDKTVVVYADEGTRLSRAMQRDGATAESIRKRMAQQMPQTMLADRADYVLRNNDSDDVEEDIQDMIEALSHPSALQEETKGQQLSHKEATTFA